MKTIGIVLRDFKSIDNQPLLGIKEELITYLRRYDVRLLCIPVAFTNNIYDEEKRVEESIELCDGIILPGGLYEHEINKKIIMYLHEKDIPTLGICLGMQEMAWSFDGSIELLTTNAHQSSEKYAHLVSIKTDSLLYKIMGTNAINVNSRHKEHITTTDLKIVAISNDLVIEAVEDATKRFFIGVQWHPESLFHDPYAKKLFDYFIGVL